MLRADVVICSDDAAFDDAEIAFNRVRMHVAPNVLADAVIDGSMGGATVVDARPAVIAHCASFGCDLRVKDRTKRLAGHGRQVMRTDTTAALHKAEHGLFAAASASRMGALAAVLVLLFAANIRFIKLDWP